MSLEQALKEAYASAPQDRVIFDTLELVHPAFVDENGLPTAIRVVAGWENISARLESDAPVNANQYVEFVAGAFNFALPGFEEARVPQMKVTVDGVSQEIVTHLEAAMSNPTPIEVIYRPFLSTDLSKPQMDPPIRMSLSGVTVTATQVTGTASMDDVHNWAFPNQKYLASRFPGLVR